MSVTAQAMVLGVSGSNAALIGFLVYTLAVFVLAGAANRLLSSRHFLSEYFLGSRSLGVWAFALTFAATSASGGSFTGFPSKIYTHGWILGLWIGSYMVVPLCAMGLLGKRINQVARISGAITVPDVLRDRFQSRQLGLLSVLLIVFFMSFNLVGQFKAGSEILKTLLQNVPVFQQAVGRTAGLKSNIALLASVESDYLLCLFVFAAAVILYTTYGGFHAVVWTDVMQGFVMVFGVMLMLPLAIYQVGGLDRATQQMARMTTPRLGYAQVTLETPPARSCSIPFPWFELPGASAAEVRLFRVNRTLAIPRGRTELAGIKVVELTTREEIEQQLARLREPAAVATFNRAVRTLVDQQIAWVQAQLAENPNDPRLQQQLARGERARVAVERNEVALLNSEHLGLFDVQVGPLVDYTYGSGQQGVYVHGPGPVPAALPRSSSSDSDTTAPPSAESASEAIGFLPLSMAVSFFFMWAISGAGQPSSMVRLMAFRDSLTLRRAMFTVAIYFSLIYFPLVIIFCCARVLLPGMELESDRIMPEMALFLTSHAGHPWLAGLLIAAPFAAVMSTVDSFLLMISSALVRDIYQRNINPQARVGTLKGLSYLVTLSVGVGAMLGAINPPQFLQDIIVYTTSGLAACFLGPMIFALYWPRANLAGGMSGMLAGFAAHLSMYLGGLVQNGSFYKPITWLNLDPLIMGLFASFVATYVVSKLTAPPPEELVRTYFCSRSSQTPPAKDPGRA